MEKFLCVFTFLGILSTLQAADVRLVDLDPPEAQQQIEQQDQSLHYAPKVESNVPAVRYLGNEPHNVLEDIYLARQYHGQDGIGGYLYGYNIPDIAKTEKKVAGGDLRGAYNYINDDGTEIKVEYWDDGTGFHQIDNVPKILPKPIEDSPEVKAEKDKFLARWQEEAERNQRPVASPYDANGNYASGPLSPQGQVEFKKMFENQPQGQYYQQSSAGSSIYQQNGQYQPAGQYHQSSQSQQGYQPAQPQQGQYYQSSQSQQSGQYQPGTQYNQGGQFQQAGHNQQGGQQQKPSQQGQYSGSTQQLSNPNQIDYAGAYSESQNSYANPSQSKPSGQYTPIASSSNQYSQQGLLQQPGQYQQSSYQQSGVGPHPGSYQQGVGNSHQGAGQYQPGQYQTSGSSKSNQVDNSGDYDKSWDNEGQYDKKYDEEEGVTGPPKGFFYSFDYPVGKIVQKGEIARVGDLKSAYAQNKASYESQVSSGQSGSAASQSSYSYSS